MAPNEFRYSRINFNEPKPWANDEATMYIIIIMFLTLTWICVAVRLYVRLRLVRSAGWDDLFVGLGLATTTLGSIMSCAAIGFGLGQHFLLLEPLQWGGYLLMFYIGNASYIGSTTFIKLALLLQYLRSFEGHVLMRRIITLVIGFTALWGLAYSLLAWFPCSPIHKFWYGDDVKGSCWGFGSPTPDPFVATFVSHSAINMMLDIAVLLVPVPLFFSNEASRSNRMRLLALLSTGCIVIAIAAWRLATLVEHKAATWPTRDPTWYGPISILLSIVEVDLACICASIPIFWPMMEKQWNRIFVTHEVQVTSEQRLASDDEDGLTHGGWHGRSASASDELGHKATTARTHYRDSYVLRQIDPLRNEPAKPDTLDLDMDGREWTKVYYN